MELSSAGAVVISGGRLSGLIGYQVCPYARMPYSAYGCGQPNGQDSIAYFIIPCQKHDGLVAHWYNVPRGRCILLRPRQRGHNNGGGDPLENEHDGPTS